MIPKVSVIIPVYNVEKYLNRCILSVQNQSIHDIEIILIDDGSPGRCPEMCDDYKKKDSRVKVVHQKNMGAGLARNTGIEIATGEYYAFLDSDDFFELDMLGQMYHKAKERNLDAVSCGICNLWEGSIKHFQVSYPEYTEVTTNDGCINEGLKAMLGICKPLNKNLEQIQRPAIWRFIFRSEIIHKRQIRFLSERDVVSEDLAMNVQFMTYAHRVGYMPDIFVYHCYNGESLTALRNKILPYNRVTRQFHFFWLLAKDNDFTEKAFDIISDYYIRNVFSLIRANLMSDISFKDKMNIVKEVSNDNYSWILIKSTNALSKQSFLKRVILDFLFYFIG